MFVFTQSRVGAVVVAVAMSAAAVRADVQFVDANNCPGPGDGSELDPYCSIQTAIDNAVDTDEIVVAPGTYFESINFLGKAITLRSSDGPQATIIDGTGFLHVIRCVSGEGPNTILDGFTITGGNADGDGFPDAGGGGMYNDNSNPTVTNCIFTGNTAAVGGGIFNDNNSSLTVTNCTFEGNTASAFGGGMYNYGSSPTVTNCTFHSNVGGGMYNTNFYDLSGPTVTNCTFSDNDGTGMYNFASSPTVINCIFSGNSANRGGGMVNSYYLSLPTVINCTFIGNTAGVGGGMANFSSNLTLTNCIFSGNVATCCGGGIYGDNGYPTMTNCVFTGNSAGSNGGAMTGSSPTVTNCVFIENTAGDTGGGISNTVDSTFANCTFSGNSAAAGGGIYHAYDSTVTNSILWGNSPDAIVEADPAVTTVHYSNVEGGWPGTGNIDADPLFVDPDNGDYRLSPGSPCIDTGDDSAVPNGVLRDLDGTPRFVADACAGDSGATVDMGAYEFQGTSCNLNNIIEMLAAWGSWHDCGTSLKDFDSD